jgi:hypothetical protein
MDAPYKMVRNYRSPFILLPGNALPQSGDLVGQSAPVKAGGGKLTLVIDSVQP